MQISDSLIQQVMQQMPDKRWKHVQGVMSTSLQLAKRFGADPEQAELAALLHDYCKCWDKDRQRQILLDEGHHQELLTYDKSLWHGPAAAAILPQEAGIHDNEVLDAVRWHTSGRVNMTKLEKIICLADYIEPSRDFPQVDRIRLLAEVSLEKALVAGLRSTISYLLEKRNTVYPLTILTWNSLVQKLNGTE